MKRTHQSAYGYFDDHRREYVITRPDTPLPWINYLGNGDFLSLISNRAGGYAFFKDARLRRLTRYRYNDAPLDSSGRFVYLRDEDRFESDSGPLVWSPVGRAGTSPLDEYACRHGMGYTIIESSCAGIQANLRFFVPPDDNVEIWEISLINQREQTAHLSLISAVEFCLWDALDDSTNFQRNYSIGEVEVDENVIYHKSEYRERRDHFAYFACSQTVASFDTQRDVFLGRDRGWDNPKALEFSQLSNSICHGWQPVAAQQVKLELRPGQQTRVIFMMGYTENDAQEKFDPPGSQVINKRKAQEVIARYRQPEWVQAAFEALQEENDQFATRLQVSTPDEHTNRMVNIWNMYQLMITFQFSRSASYFESGIGRGMGFRDSNQDLLGYLMFNPPQARQRLLDLAATQLPDGGAYHQYQPLTRKGNHDVGSGFNDDPLWLVLSVTAYLKESGDWGILSEAVPYDNLSGSEQPLLDHLWRSLQYTLDRIGPHGLPLIGRADWNDCLNLNCFSDSPGQSFQTTENREGKVAESVFIAGLFVLAAKEMQAMLECMSDSEQQVPMKNARAGWTRTALQNEIEAMQAAVMSAGWDGEWFLRAYDSFGEKVGSKSCQEGQIYIEPQGICIMAGLGQEDGKALQALNSVEQRLATPHGILLHQPAYTRYYLELGEISSYPPGYKENGAIFCHTNPWIMIAEAMQGRGDQAFSYYQRINPSFREPLADLHRCEPYVYAQMIAGRDAAVEGEAKNSWLTGTAAWNYVAITQWILGIRPTYAGLKIAPVIPGDWESFSAVRIFRGVTYHIQVVRRGAGNNTRIEVDGHLLPGNVIPFPAGDTQKVQVSVEIF